MIKYHEIIGMQVISIKEGRKLGVINNLSIDLNEKRVVGFLTENQDAEHMLLPIENIKSYGKNFIMFSSETDLPKMEDLAGMANDMTLAEKIIGLKIITNEGENFGEIDSFCFDEKHGFITH